MPSSKPSIAQLLTASGYATFESSLVSRAIKVLYGNVGANLDERDWSAILQSSNPLSAAESALSAQWQNASYLLRNAQHIEGIGYPAFSAEITYRQMAQRLDYNYSTTWSAGTSYAAFSELSNTALDAMASEHQSRLPASISFITSESDAAILLSYGGLLAWGVSGMTTSVSAGTLALTPEGVGGTLREGQIMLTRESGVATTSSEYVVVGTDTALIQSFNVSGTPLYDRLIVLGAGNDDVSAGAGNDTVLGGNGDDILLGNIGADLIYGGEGNDHLEGGRNDDTVEGGAGNDLIWGGTTGVDQLTGGTGSDQFRFKAINTNVTANDFLTADGDTLSFADGNGSDGEVAFTTVTILGSPGTPLVAADFDKVGSIAAVRSDEGGVNAGNDQVYVITGLQTTSQIQASVPSGALNSYVVVYDSTQASAKIYFDDQWADAAGRFDVATLLGLSAADVQSLAISNFMAWLD